jgi:mannosylglycoprotein endo-beta-mannosidase
VTVTLKNSTAAIGLMTHLQLHEKASGKRVLPAFYSDNYLTLVPGESRTVMIEAATKDFEKDGPEVLVDGFNVKIGDGAMVGPNVNADPMHWPASNLVADEVE